MQSNQCKLCQHYQRENESGKLHCIAFPDGIPIEIITGEYDHTNPFNGDNGIRWELSKVIKEVNE